MNYNIAVMPGDGTGPEVVAEGLKVLKAAAARAGFSYSLTDYDFGGERYLRTGETLPDSAIGELGGHDAILLGAIGHPDVKPGILEQGILLKARFALDLYINLRPVKLFPGVETPIKDKGPKEIDFVVVRENTEGLYAGTGGYFKKGTRTRSRPRRASIPARGRNAASGTRSITQARVPIAAATVDPVGKTNVLTYCLGSVVARLQRGGRCRLSHDQAGVLRTWTPPVMWFVKNPEWFDVIVTDNMFGDIITDLGAMIQGGLGVAAGGNINPGKVGMFEPIGGSAPKYTGQNVINPLAAIGAVGMMLDYLGQTEAAGWVEAGIVHAVSKMKSLSAGQMGMGTDAVGDLVAEYVAKG